VPAEPTTRLRGRDKHAERAGVLLLVSRRSTLSPRCGHHAAGNRCAAGSLSAGAPASTITPADKRKPLRLPLARRYVDPIDAPGSLRLTQFATIQTAPSTTLTHSDSAAPPSSAGRSVTGADKIL